MTLFMVQARHQNLQESQQVRRGQLQQRLQGSQQQQQQAWASGAAAPLQQERRQQPVLQKRGGVRSLGLLPLSLFQPSKTHARMHARTEARQLAQLAWLDLAWPGWLGLAGKQLLPEK